MHCDIASDQLALLRLLSSRALQNFTYNCINSLAANIKFIDSTDIELFTDDVTILRDGCQDTVSVLVTAAFVLLTHALILYIIKPVSYTHTVWYYKMNNYYHNFCGCMRIAQVMKACLNNIIVHNSTLNTDTSDISQCKFNGLTVACHCTDV